MPELGQAPFTKGEAEDLLNEYELSIWNTDGEKYTELRKHLIAIITQGNQTND